MKALIFNVFAGGPGRQALYGAIAAKGDWDVSLVVGSNWRDDFGDPVSVRRSPRFHGSLIGVPVVFPGNIPLHFYRAPIMGLIQREAPDFIYVYHEAYSVSAFQIFLANVLSLRVPIGFYSSQNIAKQYPLPFRFAERWVYRHASFAIAVSDSVAKVLRGKGYRGDLHVVPFGVDAVNHSNPGSPVRRCGNPFRIGYVGRLVPEKGVDTLLHAMSKLPRSAATLRVVGSGSAKSDLMRLASDLGIGESVTWEPARPYEETLKFYSDLDVLVVPSKTTARWKEQFGRVVIEALASGTSVLVSDSGELPRVVAATSGGWTFREGDAEDLVRRLVHAIAHPDEVQAHAAAGRAAVERRFSTEAVATAFVLAVTSAISGARNGGHVDAHA